MLTIILDYDRHHPTVMPAKRVELLKTHYMEYICRGRAGATQFSPARLRGSPATVRQHLPFGGLSVKKDMPFLTEGMSFFGEAHSGEAAFRRAYPQYAGGTDMASASLMQYYVFLHRRSCQ
jgi:hypothetical protein